MPPEIKTYWIYWNRKYGRMPVSALKNKDLGRLTGNISLLQLLQLTYLFRFVEHPSLLSIHLQNRESGKRQYNCGKQIHLSLFLFWLETVGNHLYDLVRSMECSRNSTPVEVQPEILTGSSKGKYQVLLRKVLASLGKNNPKLEV